MSPPQPYKEAGATQALLARPMHLAQPMHLRGPDIRELVLAGPRPHTAGEFRSTAIDS
jgi:hypothetical protein